MGLYQLIYQSLALVPFSTADLTALLQHCGAYNRRHDITGLLLHTADGRFLQVLEGEQAAVRHLYFNRIVTDPRHYHCRIFSEGPAASRGFSAWGMGFRVATPQDLRTLLSCVPPDSPGLMVPRPHSRPELMHLLHQFIGACQTDPSPAMEHPWPGH